MINRSPELQEFLDSIEAAILDRTVAADRVRQAAERIFTALRRPGIGHAAAPKRLPACDYFQTAIRSMSAAASPATRHARALAAIEPQLTWVQRQGANVVGEPFKSGHANASIIGRDGLETREDVWIGVSLLAPGVTYPDHRHPPEEVYVVLSPGEWRQDHNAWHEPGPGGIVYNPPNFLHAMRSSSAPLLATWCLWAGR